MGTSFSLRNTVCLGGGFGAKDLLSVRADLNDRTLTFFKNNRRIARAQQNLPFDIQVCIAVHFHHILFGAAINIDLCV